MSDIKIQPSATGTATVTLTAPATNTARTITFPDSTSTLLASDGSGASLTGILTGITDNSNATAITIDSSENVGIGVTPESWKSTYNVLQIGTQGAIFTHEATNNNMGVANNMYCNTSNVDSYINGTDQATNYKQNNGTHIFEVAASGSADAAITWTQAMLIENDGAMKFGSSLSKNYLFGTSNNSPAESSTEEGVRIGGNGGCNFSFTTSCDFNKNDSDGEAIILRRAGVNVGSIDVAASSTSYNTSSDYRLKENVVPMTGSIDRLKELKPSKFNFIADADTTVDGFLAHEVSDTVPEAISGTKDAVDDDGNPDYQGIDQSKLVPLLVSALQEAITRIETLEAN